MRRLAIVLVASVVAVLGVVWGPATTALARDGTCAVCGADSGGGGYVVNAGVHFSGDAAPGGGGTVSMGVPATCWWEPAGNVPSDPSKWEQYFSDTVTSLSQFGSEVAAGYYALGSSDVWKAAAAKAAAGESIQVYAAHCRDSGNFCDMAQFTGGQQHDVSMGYGPPMKCGVTGQYGFFPPGNPPAPLVSPEDLAKLARDQMVIPEPQVDRNPKVGSLGQATLVGLPTWFWVTNPESVGGANGTRTIRAEVAAVWAQVVATTGGLTLTSPAGGTSCAPAVATQAYTPGAADSSGCTVAFNHASVGYAGGYPVDASTAWTATWTGSGGTGGGLDGLARTTQVAVPVAESQALVNGR